MKMNKFFFVCKIGMSATLARHFGYLFMRDPLVIIKEHLHPQDDSTAYHFEVNLDSFVIIKNNF
jgi:hypothetical protein